MKIRENVVIYPGNSKAKQHSSASQDHVALSKSKELDSWKDGVYYFGFELTLTVSFL